MSNSNENVFCKYCKRLITSESEKELKNNCHNTCQEEIDSFNIKPINQFNTFKELYQEKFRDKFIDSTYELSLEETELHMQDMGLETLSDSIGCFNNLIELELNKNKLSDLPIINDGLAVLDISENEFTTIPKEVFNHTNLQILIMNQNRITEIPPDITKITFLEELSLENNFIAKLPNNFENLESLDTLNLSSNNLGMFPKKLLKMKSLGALDLSDNNIAEIPSEIRELENLDSLGLAHNHLTTIPEELGYLKIKDLYLQHNELDELPDSIGELPLFRLHLSNNKFKKMPECLAKLKTNGIGYFFLYFSNMKLSNLPEKCFSETISLSHLEMANCGLEKLPEDIGRYTNIGNLIIPENDLQKLPDTICNLKGMVQIDLTNNPLRQLPDEFWKTKVNWLFADGTRLEKLPDEIGRGHIVEYHLRGTKITELPDFNPMNDPKKYISVLDIRDTPLEEVPESISKLPIKIIYVSNETLERKFESYKNCQRVLTNQRTVLHRAFAPKITERFG